MTQVKYKCNRCGATKWFDVEEKNKKTLKCPYCQGRMVLTQEIKYWRKSEGK